MAFLEAHVGNHPLEVAGEVQKILYCNQPVWRVVGGAQRTGRGGGPQPVLGLGADCAAACIRQGGPHVASGNGAANTATHCVLANSGSATPLVSTCCCCGASGSHYLLFFEEDCDAMLEIVDAYGVELAAVSGDVVERTNYILKKGYNGHSSRCGNACQSAVERDAMGV